MARHLLALSTVSGSEELPVVYATQQALADSVGSVREVVSRCLRTFRQEGLIAIGPAAITIVNAEALQQASG